jgi:hypothetical protein
MPDPEISGRCPSCGASVKRRASFCTQCGSTIGIPGRDGSARKSGLPPKKGVTFAKRQPAPKDLKMDDLKREEVGKETGALSERTLISTFFQTQSNSGRRDGGIEAARAKVKDNLLPKMEKLRQASHDVLDEAAVDPSVRFLVVAVALILLSLILIAFSNFLR